MSRLPQIIELMRLCDASEQDKTLIRTLPWEIDCSTKHRQIVGLGATPDFAFLLLEGWAARFSVRRNGTRRITGFLLPGDLSWIHALAAAEMDHAIVAVTDCVYAKVPAYALLQAAGSSANVSMALLRAKLVDEAILRTWLRNSEDAERSVGHLICELHARLKAAGLAQGESLQVPLTQEQIGDALSLTSVHTNRMIRKLREYGFITKRGSQIKIVDIDALRRFSAFNPSYLHQTL